MTLPEYFESIAREACPAYHWYYDIRQMQNVGADNVAFPAIWMEEYYAERYIEAAYDTVREVTVEIHFQNLVPMQGVALDREVVRDQLRQTGVHPFVAALRHKMMTSGWPDTKEWQADPEPPMFDANATGVLLRMTVMIPSCAVL